MCGHIGVVSNFRDDSLLTSVQFNPYFIPYFIPHFWLIGILNRVYPMQRKHHGDRVVFKPECVDRVIPDDGRHSSSGLLAQMQLHENIGKLFVHGDRAPLVKAIQGLPGGKLAKGSDLYPIGIEGDHGRVQRKPIVVDEGIVDCFIVGLLVKKIVLFSRSGPVPFVGLGDVQRLAEIDDPIDGIKDTAVADFLDHVHRVGFASPGKDRDSDRNPRIIGQKSGQKIVFAFSGKKTEIVFERSF